MKFEDKLRTSESGMLQNAAKPICAFCTNRRHAFQPVFMRVWREGCENGVKPEGRFLGEPSHYVIENK
jgi:hypothetical protein